MEMSMIINSHKNILHHLFFLSFLHLLIKVVLVHCWYQYNVISLEVVIAEVHVVPDSHLTIEVEPDVLVGDVEGAKLLV